MFGTTVDFFFRLVDAKLPPIIETGVCEGLSSPLLLPPLSSRMSILHQLLPKSPEDWGRLSRGQVKPGSWGLS